MFLIFGVGDSTIFINLLLILFRVNLALKTTFTSIITNFKNPKGKKKSVKKLVDLAKDCSKGEKFLKINM